jgi:predicted amidohydrolase
LLTVERHGWRIRPFICYDLRFPVWTRNVGNRYDLALYIASWPAVRRDHWKLLLQARAVENLSYVAGVNRVGVDGNGVAFAGDSAVIGPAGEILCCERDRPVVRTLRLSYENLQAFREKFPAWKDADTGLLHLPE